jgi:hypothetical protein
MCTGVDIIFKHSDQILSWILVVFLSDRIEFIFPTACQILLLHIIIKVMKT